MYSYDYWCHHCNSYWWVMIQTAQVMLIACNTLFPRIFRFLHLERIRKANWVRWNEWSLQLRFSLDKNGVFVRKTYKRNSVVSPRIAGLQSGCCFRHLILLQVPGPGPQLSFFTLRCWLSTAELGSSWEPCLFIQQSKSILSKSGSLSINIIK